MTVIPHHDPVTPWSLPFSETLWLWLWPPTTLRPHLSDRDRDTGLPWPSPLVTVTVILCVRGTTHHHPVALDVLLWHHTPHTPQWSRGSRPSHALHAAAWTSLRGRPTRSGPSAALGPIAEIKKKEKISWTRNVIIFFKNEKLIRKNSEYTKYCGNRAAQQSQVDVILCLSSFFPI